MRNMWLPKEEAEEIKYMDFERDGRKIIIGRLSFMRQKKMVL